MFVRCLPRLRRGLALALIFSVTLSLLAAGGAQASLFAKSEIANGASAQAGEGHCANHGDPDDTPLQQSPHAAGKACCFLHCVAAILGETPAEAQRIGHATLSPEPLVAHGRTAPVEIRPPKPSTAASA